MTKYRVKRRARSWAVQRRNYNPIAILAVAAAIGDSAIVTPIKWRTLYTTRSRRLATFVLWFLREFRSK